MFRVTAGLAFNNNNMTEYSARANPEAGGENIAIYLLVRATGGDIICIYIIRSGSEKANHLKRWDAIPKT